MTDTEIRARAVALYDRFTHEHHDRRAFMREMTLLTGSAAAAAVLIDSIAASPAAAQMVPVDDARLTTGDVPGEAGAGGGYFARPRDETGMGAVIVVHENRGLTGHIRDVARRVALAGFHAFAPDYLGRAGGTPGDEDAARTMIGTLDLSVAVSDTIATIVRLKTMPGLNGKVGITGFCWGGAMVNRVLVAAGGGIDAGVSYYGPAPAPEDAARVEAPLMLQLAGRDARVNATAEPFAAALTAAGKPVTLNIYPDVDHAFNNDTSAARYNKAAADLAWARTIGFFREHLAA